MRLQNLRFILLLGTLAFGTSHAIPMVGDLDIDFRGNDWSGAYGQSSWTAGDVTAGAWIVTGLQNTIASGRNQITAADASSLYQDGTDGLGILAGEMDEIDLDEVMWLVFHSTQTLTGAWVTDLFAAPDGGRNGEDGGLLLFLADQSIEYFEFNGNYSDQANGEQFIDFMGSYNVAAAAFFATDTRGDEFSVAGFVSSVPEPGPLGLLALSLILVGVITRKRIS